VSLILRGQEQGRKVLYCLCRSLGCKGVEVSCRSFPISDRCKCTFRKPTTPAYPCNLHLPPQGFQEGLSKISTEFVMIGLSLRLPNPLRGLRPPTCATNYTQCLLFNCFSSQSKCQITPPKSLAGCMRQGRLGNAVFVRTRTKGKMEGVSFYHV